MAVRLLTSPGDRPRGEDDMSYSKKNAVVFKIDLSEGIRKCAWRDKGREGKLAGGGGGFCTALL